MSEITKIGIIICDRYKTCAGGKCFRSLKRKEGAFKVYRGKEVEVAGYTSCGGCPGGNIEYAPEEMIKNGVEVIHLATGFLVGYPPCPYTAYFHDFIENEYKIQVVYGTHPIPQKYYLIHEKMETWKDPAWEELLEHTLCDEKMRKAYD